MIYYTSFGFATYTYLGGMLITCEQCKMVDFTVGTSRI